jgi:glycosyltransferase involved in cell wall biosynthesis
MKERGHTPFICCYDARGDIEADRAEGLGIPVEVILREPGIDLGYIRKLRRWLRSVRADVVHTHNSTALFYGALAGVAAGTPVRIATEHDGVFPRSRRAAVSNRWLVASALTHTVAVSEAVKTLWVESDGIDAERVQVIPNGVPDTRLDRTAHDGFTIGTVGRLSTEKGADVLLRAFAELAKTRTDLRLILVGDGPARPEVEGEIAALGLRDRVELLGTRSDVPELLAGFDLFVLPSRREGLPLAILEAMAAGLPIVASKVGGIPEAISHGDQGLLVPPEDVGALAGAIDRLILEPDRRTALGRSARRRFEEHYELSKMVDRYEALMHSGDRPLR